MPSTISPNMGLILPSIGLEPGPTYGQDQNNSMTIIDAHDHTPGNGVQLTPASLNINADVDFMNNDAVNLRSTRFFPQSGPLSDPTDLGCLYENGVDLYYNDGNGNQIRLTQSGSIAGTSGSITGLVSPASASYVSGSKTFVFQQDVNKAANMDIASLIIRKTTTSSPGITISAPSSLSANYTLTLPPSPPAQNSVLVMDTSGNVTTTAQAVDLSITGNLSAGGTATAGATTVASLAVGATSATAGNINTTGDINTNNINCNSLNAATEIFPSGGSNAKLIASSNKIIEVANDGVASRPIVTSVINATTYIVAGSVDESGTIIQGGGFTVSVTNPGSGRRNFNITFSDPFLNPPVVITSAAVLNPAATVGNSSWLLEVTSSTCIIQLAGLTVSTDALQFIAVGERAN